MNMIEKSKNTIIFMEVNILVDKSEIIDYLKCTFQRNNFEGND